MAGNKRQRSLSPKFARDVPLAGYTRFGIGGPAALFCEATNEEEFFEAVRTATERQLARQVIGGGTNLVISDAGFDGAIIRYTGAGLEPNGTMLRVEAGALLQDVVDLTIELGLNGLHTMTGIPGFVGGAVYGNAGAYGRSIQELVRNVRVFDGEQAFHLSGEECRFRYRDSIFKDRKDCIILSVELEFTEDDPQKLARTAAEIRSIRDVKYPPRMKCAGSIFKNLLLADLSETVASQVPANVIREGKVPSAWFLEQTGAKGMRRGDIQVADYHANLIYNDGSGTARDLVAIIRELKNRVNDRFGLELEEEIQYVGFDYVPANYAGSVQRQNLD